MTNPPSTAPDGATADSGVKVEAFTPGPWHMCPRWATTPWPVIASDYGLIAETNVLTLRQRAEANARLIAAAPDLLATLQAIAGESVFNQQRFAEDTDTDYFLRCFKAVKDRARAAIAKATGQ